MISCSFRLKRPALRREPGRPPHSPPPIVKGRPVQCNAIVQMQSLLPQRLLLLAEQQPLLRVMFDLDEPALQGEPGRPLLMPPPHVRGRLVLMNLPSARIGMVAEMVGCVHPATIVSNYRPALRHAATAARRQRYAPAKARRQKLAGPARCHRHSSQRRDSVRAGRIGSLDWRAFEASENLVSL